MNILEIGLEKEMFLLDADGNIMEPKLFGFPRDEFEFLVELRSLPSDRLYPVYMTLHQEELQYKLRADKFGMKLESNPNRIETDEWVRNHWDKYNLHRFNALDYTKNIYDNNKESHHLGVLDHTSTSKRLTAGIHVHFSSRNAETGEIIQLPIESIVGQMDEIFKKEIKLSKRNKGEYEEKVHGFEYRSLPCDTDIYKILKESFKILRSV
jgi:hypothetical protein